MTMKEVAEKLVVTLKQWQKAEDEAVQSTGEVIAEMENPMVKAVFEIIQRDAQNHRKIQEIIIQAHESKGFQLTVEQLGELSKVISRHVAIEKRMIGAAQEALDMIKGKKWVLHEYFLTYLQEDEKKHMGLLEGLENIKRNMYPYGPSA